LGHRVKDGSVVLKTWGRSPVRGRSGVDTSGRAGNGLSRRGFGVVLGSSIVVGAGGLSALAAAFAAAGPPGTTTVAASFGKVRIAGAQRQSRLAAGTGASAHGGHTVAGTTSAQPANMTYGDHLVLRLDVFNESDEDILFSPGQLRVRPNTQPWLVVNRGSDLRADVLPSGGSVSGNVSFLVPSDAGAFSAQFDDVVGKDPQALHLPLPSVAWRPGYREGGHA
jgi:hypothetical protein